MMHINPNCIGMDMKTHAEQFPAPWELLHCHMFSMLVVQHKLQVRLLLASKDEQPSVYTEKYENSNDKDTLFASHI